MLTNWQEWLEYLIPSLKEKRETEKLALQAEMVVRELSDLPPANLDERDVVTILKSICLLLERFQDNPELLKHKETTPTQPVEVINTEEVPSVRLTKLSVETSKGSRGTGEAGEAGDAGGAGGAGDAGGAGGAGDAGEEEDKAFPKSIEPQPESPTVPQVVRATPEEKPTATAEELIRLRDWVLLAKSGAGEDQASPQVLDAIYERLGKILEKEGITSLEEMGNFNYERQQVVSTQVTDDPEKEDSICDTVRPGYLFHESLIRPQEVIVYTYERSQRDSAGSPAVTE